MEKYHILILSNCVGSGYIDDCTVRDAFIKDGHIAVIKTVGYDKKDDDMYDVVIRRNTWVSTREETEKLYEDNQKLINRLFNKKKKTVNMVGLDGHGKGYLCEMYEKGYRVIPTINSYKKIDSLPIVNKYVIKDYKSFGNGLFQKVVSKDMLKTKYQEGNIVQPYIDFIAEVQCYYVGKKLMYVLEYTPSKYPNYPRPEFITLTDKEKQLADDFAAYAKLEYGFQRIDFLRLPDNQLIMMEIEDHAAFMNLQILPTKLQAEVMNMYVNNIYEYIYKG